MGSYEYQKNRKQVSEISNKRKEQIAQALFLVAITAILAIITISMLIGGDL